MERFKPYGSPKPLTKKTYIDCRYLFLFPKCLIIGRALAHSHNHNATERNKVTNFVWAAGAEAEGVERRAGQGDRVGGSAACGELPHMPCGFMLAHIHYPTCPVVLCLHMFITSHAL